MKRFIALIMAMVLLLCCCACGDSDTGTKKKKKKIVYIDEPSSSVTQSTDDSSDNSSSFVEDTASDIVDTIVDTQDAVSEVSLASKITSASIGDNYYYLSPETWHPGVVELDAHYEMIARDRRNRELDASRIVLTCSEGDVKINGNTVTIPYSIRAKGKPITVKMHDSKYPNRTGEYKFEFRQFSETPAFEDDFDVLDLNVWRKDWYGGDRNGGEVIDGKLVSTCTSIDSPGMEISTTQGYTQAFGCFSASIKMPDKGINNAAFWLCSDYLDISNKNAGRVEGLYNPQAPGQSGIEIDIVEYSAAWESRYAATTHWYGWSTYHESEGMEGLTINGADLAADFYIYSLVWTEDTYYFYLNDQLVWSKTGEGVGYGPVAILLQLGNGTQDGWVGTFENVYPYSVEFDWVRTWTLEDLDWSKTNKPKE